MSFIDPVQTPVTGSEKSDGSRDPRHALAQFYRALNTRDMGLMRQNWDDTVEAAMDNPLGGIRRGWHEIGPAYEALFASKGRYSFELYDYTLHETADLFYVVGRERGQLEVNGQPMRLAIRTTRVFRRDAAERWRQVHHHGSIDDSQMLAAYQDAVLNRR